MMVGMKYDNFLENLENWSMSCADDILVLYQTVCEFTSEGEGIYIF